MYKNITLIGTGNLATHLLDLFLKNELNVYVIGRNAPDIAKMQEKIGANATTNFEINSNSDLVLVCVSDTAIAEVVAKIPITFKVVITSGVFDWNILPKRDAIGTFYPLQTFSKNRPVAFGEIPIILDTSNRFFDAELEGFARIFTNSVYFVNIKQREKLHISAVFVNNFTNHLLVLAKSQMILNRLDWDILTPLIKETFLKALETDPVLAQTGPAKRNDKGTIQKHLAALDKNQAAIYKELTNSILNTYGHEKL